MAKTRTQTKVTVTDIGRDFLGRHNTDTAYIRGQWHSYGNGVWVPLPDQEMRREVWMLLEAFESRDGLQPTLGLCNAALDYLAARLFVRDEQVDASPDLVVLANGTYDVRRGKLLDHSPDHYLTSSLPFDYDPTARAELWQMYLMTTFTGPRTTIHDRELIEFVQEAMGYSLTSGVEHHVTFWCLGEGANGKGVLFHVLECLGGSTAVPLNVGLLKREQYQLGGLAGKNIALCSESNVTQNLVEDAIIKALISGDSMSVRQIRREPFTLRPTVKLWWAMNDLPPVADTSSGFWRRVRVVPFNRSFDEHERILDLKERLEGELAGIFIWAMDGLRRLRQRGRFVSPRQVEDMTALYRRESNAIQLFVDEICEVRQGAIASSSSIYQRYKHWCEQNTYRPKSAKNFKDEMERLGFYTVRRAQGVYYDGIEVKPWGIP